MSELASLIQQIKEAAVVANENIEDGNVQTLTARRGRKKRAQDTLKQLTTQYARELMRTSVFILTSGTESDTFTKTAVEEFNCFTSDAEGFYNDLASRIPPVLYQNKTAVANLFETVGRHLEDKALEMDVTGYPMLVFKEKYKRVLNSKEDLVALLKEAINADLGSEFAGIHIVRSIAQDALAKEHANKITPIVLNVKDAELLAALLKDLQRLTPHVFLVLAGKARKELRSVEGVISLKDGDKENVVKAMTQIKTSIRN